jgi:hypothetical protein
MICTGRSPSFSAPVHAKRKYDLRLAEQALELQEIR